MLLWNSQSLLGKPASPYSLPALVVKLKEVTRRTEGRTRALAMRTFVLGKGRFTASVPMVPVLFVAERTPELYAEPVGHIAIRRMHFPRVAAARIMGLDDWNVLHSRQTEFCYGQGRDGDSQAPVANRENITFELVQSRAISIGSGPCKSQRTSQARKPHFDLMNVSDHRRGLCPR